MPCCSLLGASSPPKSTILSLLGKSRFSLSGEQKKVRMPSISNESLVALASGQWPPIRHLLDICVESLVGARQWRWLCFLFLFLDICVEKLVGAQQRRWHWLPQRQSPIVSKLDPPLILHRCEKPKNKGSGRERGGDARRKQRQKRGKRNEDGRSKKEI